MDVDGVHTNLFKLLQIVERYQVQQVFTDEQTRGRAAATLAQSKARIICIFIRELFPFEVALDWAVRARPWVLQLRARRSLQQQLQLLIVAWVFGRLRSNNIAKVAVTGLH